MKIHNYLTESFAGSVLFVAVQNLQTADYPFGDISDTPNGTSTQECITKIKCGLDYANYSGHITGRLK